MGTFTTFIVTYCLLAFATWLYSWYKFLPRLIRKVNKCGKENNNLEIYNIFKTPILTTLWLFFVLWWMLLIPVIINPKTFEERLYEKLIRNK